MKRTTNPTRYDRSPAKKFVAGVAMLAVFFTVLVAMAYPVITAAAVAGAGTALLYRRAVGFLNSRWNSTTADTVAEKRPPLKELDSQRQ